MKKAILTAALLAVSASALAAPNANSMSYTLQPGNSFHQEGAGVSAIVHYNVDGKNYHSQVFFYKYIAKVVSPVTGAKAKITIYVPTTNSTPTPGTYYNEANLVKALGKAVNLKQGKVLVAETLQNSVSGYDFKPSINNFTDQDYYFVNGSKLEMSSFMLNNPSN